MCRHPSKLSVFPTSGSVFLPCFQNISLVDSFSLRSLKQESKEDAPTQQPGQGESLGKGTELQTRPDCFLAGTLHWAWRKAFWAQDRCNSYARWGYQGHSVTSFAREPSNFVRGKTKSSGCPHRPSQSPLRWGKGEKRQLTAFPCRALQTQGRLVTHATSSQVTPTSSLAAPPGSDGGGGGGGVPSISVHRRMELNSYFLFVLQ